MPLVIPYPSLYLSWRMNGAVGFTGISRSTELGLQLKVCWFHAWVLIFPSYMYSHMTVGWSRKKVLFGSLQAIKTQPVHGLGYLDHSVACKTSVLDDAIANTCLSTSQYSFNLYPVIYIFKCWLLMGGNETSYCQNKAFQNQVRCHPDSRKHIQKECSGREIFNLWFQNPCSLLRSCFQDFWISWSFCQCLSTSWWLNLWWEFCCRVFPAATPPVSASALPMVSFGRQGQTSWLGAFCTVWGGTAIVAFFKKTPRKM